MILLLSIEAKFPVCLIQICAYHLHRITSYIQIYVSSQGQSCPFGKNIDFPIKKGDFPIKNVDFPIKNCDFPIKNGDFPMKNCDFPIKNGVF